MGLQRSAATRLGVSKGQAILVAAVLPWFVLLYLGILAHILLS